MGSPVYLFGQPQQQPQQPNLFEALLGKFLQGQQIASYIKSANAEADERKLRSQILKHQLNTMKLEETLQPHKDQQMIYNFLQNKPGQTFGQSAEMPGLANVPQMLGGPGGTMPGQPMGLPPVEAPHPELEVGPGIFARPQNQQQGLQQMLAELGMKNRSDAAGAYAKTSAESAAKQPYELEAIDARAGVDAKKLAEQQRFDVEKLAEQQRFEAEQKGLDRSNSRGIAATNLQAANANRNVERENKLMDDFSRDTKDFAVMDDAYAKIQASAKLGTGPGDIALIYGFMRLQDPGSTVREGEYATAQNSAGIPDRIRAAYNKAIDGEKLAPAVRANFVATAKSTYESVKPRLKMVEAKYQGRAKKVGADPELFKFQSGAEQGGPKVGDRKTFPNGRTGVWDGTGWVAQ